MLTIFIRTILVYAILLAGLRLMGKRQLGELEISELVITLLISEIATLPIVDQSIPLSYAVVPLVTLLTLEVLLSALLIKCPRLKGVAASRPSILIRQGELQQGELSANRISLDELISEIRQAGYAGPEEVDYAVLEQNGRISVLPKRAAQPPSAEALGVQVGESGIFHLLIADGRRNQYNMKELGLSDGDLDKLLRKQGLEEKELFFMGRNDAGELFWAKKEDRA